MAEIEKKPVKIVETILRDAHQSLIATRMTTEQMLPIIEKMDHKYRIPQGTAKQMLLYDEAPVYRLLPSGSEKIAPIAAVSTGLWYENYREFAIAPEDLGALDKLIRRETDRPYYL